MAEGTEGNGKGFRFPSAFTILLAPIVVAAVLTWIIPAGQYETALSEELGRPVPIPGSYHRVEPTQNPTKPIGPVYDAAEASRIGAETGWIFAEEIAWTVATVVPSPVPRRILEIEVIHYLVDAEVVVICAGGGGIPTRRSEDGKLGA